MSGKEFTQKMLLQTSFTGELEEQSRVAEKNINKRFFSWMVSRKFAEQSDLSDDLNFTANEKEDDVIFNHSDRTSKYQRVLLEVEKDEIKPVLWRSRLTQEQMVKIHGSSLHKIDLKALIG